MQERYIFFCLIFISCNNHSVTTILLWSEPLYSVDTSQSFIVTDNCFESGKSIMLVPHLVLKVGCRPMFSTSSSLYFAIKSSKPSPHLLVSFLYRVL